MFRNQIIQKNQDHETSEHHHDHDHTKCNHPHHHHDEPGDVRNKRHVFTLEECSQFELEEVNELMRIADDFLTEEEFGKVVPIFEIAHSKLSKQDLNNLETAQDLMNLKQNLAFSYGIIGEHEKAIPLWKTVISFKEKDQNAQSEDLLDDFFGIALSYEQCSLHEEFLVYIQKGLELAKNQNKKEYIASFEHELGVYYCHAHEFKNSEDHFLNSIKIRDSIFDVVGLATSKMYMGIMFEEQKIFEKAKEFYESALQLTKDENFSDELTHERQELEFRLSQIQNLTLKNKLLNI